MSSAKKNQGDASDAQIVVLQQMLEQLKMDYDKLKDVAARAQADLQNSKARMEREAGELRKFAFEGLIRELLPTVDNFQRAFAHLPQELKNHEWVKGVQAVEQDLMRSLQSAGLKRMESIGQSVDPSKHEVLQAGPGKADTVTEVYEDGYEYQGKVLRPAKVKVGDGSAA